ncbi:hypothetical protein OG417_36130 [Actinoallomurus sp. NBC_01490]|uniref:hypothetical protein n=1 Tax=Actinoallomurus sp. NBC_01490 TaxID=2903557 RepID=UPI002E320F24|nr:hypothetical protein [Actinoallomurus sp. NBC_01490]
MTLTEWARGQGINPHATYRWFRNGALSVPAQRFGSRTILMNIDAATTSRSLATWVRMPASPSAIRRPIWKPGRVVVEVGGKGRSPGRPCGGGDRLRHERLPVEGQHMLADPVVTSVVVEREIAAAG